MALTLVSIAPSNANIRPVEEAPLYETPEGSSSAVITNGGRIIGDYFAWGDDTAFAIVEGVADEANGDEFDVGFDLGFDINFFGKNYDKVFLNTNGFITFEGASENYGYSLSNLIAGVCDDVYDGVCPEGGVTGIAAFSPDLYQYGERDGVTRGMYFGQATLPSGDKGMESKDIDTLDELLAQIRKVA